VQGALQQDDGDRLTRSPTVKSTSTRVSSGTDNRLATASRRAVKWTTPSEASSRASTRTSAACTRS
jgi:hypothetical protein